MSSERIPCPVCSRSVVLANINKHLDEGCPAETQTAIESNDTAGDISTSTTRNLKSPVIITARAGGSQTPSKPYTIFQKDTNHAKDSTSFPKRSLDHSRTITDSLTESMDEQSTNGSFGAAISSPSVKRQKTGATTSANLRSAMPLAERVRPTDMSQILGQDIVKFLRKIIEEGERIPSIILWGGPGTGKTTIARCIANMTKARFVELSGTSNGVSDCKKIFAEAKSELLLTGRKSLLFIDEIHRFSKSQQDVFCATTENPSFKVVNALLSRCRTLILKPLFVDDIKIILHNALKSEFLPPASPPPLLTNSIIQYLAEFATGDARTALNLLEIAISLTSGHNASSDQNSTKAELELKQSITRTHIYDRAGDSHYDFISAFIKSMRGSDPDAALYYLGRMLKGGEDPLFVSRRMIIFASEDVGLGDNSMLPLAIATHTAVQQVGLPEARINLAHCVAALSLAKKSTRSYRGLKAVMDLLDKDPDAASLPVPLHLRNAPTQLMKDLDYGKDYKYPPRYVEGQVKQHYLPDKLYEHKFLDNSDMGDKVDADVVLP